MVAEADMYLTQQAFQSERSAYGPGDEKLYVKFELHPARNHEKSLQEGRPIFEDKEYVTIMVPGDKNSIVKRPVWEQDKQRFPKQYAAFREGREQSLTGTPLEIVPWLTRPQVEELKFFHVRTVEQLAEVSDVNAQKFRGIIELRQKARDWVQAAKDAAPLAQMREELDKRDQAILELQQTVAALQAQSQKQVEAKK